jgi:hypothetical protein
VIVPVYVPSFAWSGLTFEVAVGDQVRWNLIVSEDRFVPEHLLETIEAEAEPKEPQIPPDYYPALVRSGSFAAWWEADHLVTGKIKLRAAFSMHDSRFPPDPFPQASGKIVGLHWALDHLRQPPDGVWGLIVRGIGLVQVESTQDVPDQPGFTFYLPTAEVPEFDGRWRHKGWIAMLECDSQGESSLSS